MTREEAKNWLNKLYARSDITNEYGDMEDMQPYEEAVNVAIKALEQEHVLDKISIEIEQVKVIMNEEIINHNRKDLINFINGLNQSLLIIDKYKAESEETE